MNLLNINSIVKNIIINRKLILFSFIIFLCVSVKKRLIRNIKNINLIYSSIQSEMKLNFNYSINKIIRIAIYTVSMQDGGLQRITSKLINFLEPIKIFKIYLFNQKEKQPNEYKISNNINRVVIRNSANEKYLIKQIKKNKIDIFIYQFPKVKEIKALNNLKNVKVIFYIHSSFLYWFYSENLKVLKIYNEYSNSKYIVSLTPLENNYLFEKWGINSILFDNFQTYDYNLSIQSNLLENKILLIGRGRSEMKRFNLGIQAIEYIKNEISNVKLLIVSKYEGIQNLKNCIDNLDLGNNIVFANYSSDPSIYYKSASLNFLTSMSESYSLVLSETKIYGIPTIIMGLDFLSLAKKGTIIVYDDLPETLAKISVKILHEKLNKKYLSKNARKSMKKIRNELIFNKWKKLILLVYNDFANYTKYFLIKKNTNELHKILENQVILLNNRINYFGNINISFIENLVKYNISDIKKFIH